MEDEIAVWLRAQAEADLSAARIIGAGGFEPQRWDTDPPGQVNPERVPYRAQIHALLVPDAEDRLLRPDGPQGWVQVVAYDRLLGEPPEADCRDSDLPVMLVDDGRREVDHVIRHDPRTEAARAESVLAVLDEYAKACEPGVMLCLCGPGPAAPLAGFGAEREAKRKALRQAVRLLAFGYRHRDGWQETWKP